MCSYAGPLRTVLQCRCCYHRPCRPTPSSLPGIISPELRGGTAAFCQRHAVQSAQNGIAAWQETARAGDTQPGQPWEKAHKVATTTVMSSCLPPLNTMSKASVAPSEYGVTFSGNRSENTTQNSGPRQTQRSLGCSTDGRQRTLGRSNEGQRYNAEF